jgi:Tfp pilus assembly protein PilV
VKERFIAGNTTIRLQRTNLKRSRESGFTLLEVLGAAFVLTIAIGSSLTILARGFNSLDSARWMSYSSQIMQSEFEKMRLTPWTEISGTSGTAYNPAMSEGAAAEASITIDPAYYTSLGDMGIRMSLTRKAFWADGHTGDKEVVAVKLTMKWKTRDGRELKRSYITYYGKSGLYDYISS